MKRIFLMIAVVTATITANAQSNVAKSAFNNTLKSYFDTKNALAKDNANLASEGAKNLLSTLETFPVTALTATQQGLWKIQAQEMKKAATAIISEKAIKEQRKSFWPLSSAIIKLANELGMNNKEIYVQYCPMAKKSWLNEVAAVQNPFYGSMMYDCGEVTSTLSKK
jgi:hypothetical protein